MQAEILDLRKDIYHWNSILREDVFSKGFQ